MAFGNNIAGNGLLHNREESVQDHSPLPADRAPILTGIVYFFQLWALKLFFTVLITYLRIFHASPETEPTLIRNYASRPSLQVRIFIPKPHIANKTALPAPSAKSLLPLYFHIHGGGYAVGDAALGDRFCSSWCQHTGMLVASLNYSKTPLHPFPTAVHDIAVLARSVIEDSSLPIDKSRVMIAGCSAGGNLAFASSLLPELQGKIRGVVAYYPVVDWSAPPHVKFAERLYTEKPNELLATAGPFLDCGYVRAGQDRKAELLSPCYAAKEELPKYICMVGAQHDMLCREARDMIYSLAGKKMPDIGWETGFEEGTYKWMLIMGVRHGFMDDFQMRGQRGDKRRKTCDEMCVSVHRWLVEKVLD